MAGIAGIAAGRTYSEIQDMPDKITYPCRRKPLQLRNIPVF